MSKYLTKHDKVFSITNYLKSNLSEAEKDILDTLLNHINEGHSCLAIRDKKTLELLNNSQLLAKIDENNFSLDIKPLTLLQLAGYNLLYLTRYAFYELNIVQKLKQLQHSPVADNTIINLESYNDKFPSHEQVTAIQNSCSHKLSIITGGPGTGKTTTVAELLAKLVEKYSLDNLKIKIVAPTGKAANRVEESLTNSLQAKVNSELLLDYLYGRNQKHKLIFGTIHSLLGFNGLDEIYFKYNQSNPLDCDILVVDESSMISLPLFYKLLDAIDINQIKHILFLGDKNQLSAVEEGNVFASLVNLKNNQSLLADYSFISELTFSQRNKAAVGVLAKEVLDGVTTSTVLNQNIATILKPAKLATIKHDVLMYYQVYLDYLKSTPSSQLDINQLFYLFKQNMLQCLVNSGEFGVDTINYELENDIKITLNTNRRWYDGRAVMIKKNDKTFGVFNGDIGIYLNGKVYFENKKPLVPAALPEHQLAYAITIHKSQGSEAENVFVVLNNQLSDKNDIKKLLQRELIYTAITRAKNQVTIYASQDVLNYAISNPISRESGLELLWDVV